MRYLTPEELPPVAGQAIARLLQEDGEAKPHWTVERVWENGERPPGYAVTLSQADQVRAFTVVPVSGVLETATTAGVPVAAGGACGPT